MPDLTSWWALAIEAGLLLVHAAVIFGIVLLEKRQPSATLAWILVLIFMPGVGLLLYLLLGTTRMRRVARRSQRISARVEAVLEQHRIGTRLGDTTAGRELDARTGTMVRLARALSSTPASGDNQATPLVDGAATYRAIIEAIEAAADHIHVEFYIIQPDASGVALRDRLAKRAAEGLAVRVLCDAVGSARLPANFWDPLRAAGGHAAYFAPVARLLGRWRRRDRVDFRNHRKIVVVDGKTAFTGGINVGREYLGLDPSIGRWRDTHVRVAGPAALALQQTFVEDWLTATDELLDEARYFPEVEARGEHVVQMVDSGPDREWSPISYLLVQAIALSRQRVWLASPYYIPSPELQAMLTAAALRGVDVRLLLPRRADHVVLTWASQSYYGDLTSAGVKIYEYDRGFLHAKTMLVDTWMATIGSANLDMRSFHLNFELNALVFSDAFVAAMADQFLRDLAEARLLDLGAERRLAYPRRLVRSAARLLSPLL